MYIIKNALRCIARSKGRNLLISIITLVIAVSACLGLSIRQAAQSTKESRLNELTVTASISYDRSAMMNNMTGEEKGQSGKFDRDQFKDMMGNATSLSIEEYEKYATASSVEDFYYTLTAAFNGNDDLLPVTDEADFAVKVYGDSMLPKYASGDILLVKSAESVDTGEYGIFSVDGESFVKKFGGDRLISLNPAYADISLSEFSRIVCFGKVLGKLKK